MNLSELIIFLLVTGAIGALVGGMIGLFTGGFAKGAQLGALFGPVAAHCIITIVVFFCGLRNKLERKKEDRTTS